MASIPVRTQIQEASISAYASNIWKEHLSYPKGAALYNQLACGIHGLPLPGSSYAPGIGPLISSFPIMQGSFPSNSETTSDW